MTTTTTKTATELRHSTIIHITSQGFVAPSPCWAVALDIADDYGVLNRVTALKYGVSPDIVEEFLLYAATRGTPRAR